ncbi:EAL domain-containing protein [Marinobacter sp.]|uniref:EAL domain-containing protein n=1 Tax=Marinobacter sp. TaxID=50741 RepID=UPI0035694948
MRKIAYATLKTVLISCSAWLLAAALCAVVGYLYLARDVSLENSYLASQTIRDIEKISSRINSTSMALAGVENLSCSSESRRILRGYVFVNAGISDIGIYGKEGVACTAMTDVLPEESIDPENFIPVSEKGRIWRSRDLIENDGIDPSLAFSNGKLIYFVEPFPIEERGRTRFLWEFVYTNGGPFTISGSDGLYRKYSDGSGGRHGIVSIECSNSFNICVVIMIPWEAIIAEHFPILVVLSLITLLLGFWFSSLIRWQVNRSSTAAARSLAAINKRAFHCAYQPIVDLETGHIAGCEVLARLEDRYGPLSPAEFIPVVARNNLMNEFSKMIFDQAYSGIRELKVTGRKRFKLSFNIFPSNLNKEMVSFFQSHPALADERLQICLEVTEDSSISEHQYREFTEQLNRIGIEVSVDDFGTGYGNMSRLKSAFLSYLKVDKSLVSHLTPGNVKDSLTSYIPLIADNAGMQIVAEGIETEENLAAIRSLQIRFGQGYYFSRPLPPADFIDLVVSGKNWAEQEQKSKVVELAAKAKSRNDH